MLKEEQVSTPEISQLESQARQAYQQRRTRECIALIKSLLQLDSKNAEAKSLQAAIQKEIHRDLNDANALLEDSKGRPDGSKYRKAAEIILLKITYLDPENEDARSLLASLRTVDGHKGAPPVVAASQPLDATPPAPAKTEEVPFTTGAVFETKKVDRRRRRFTVPVILLALVAIAGVVFLIQQSRTTLAEGVAESPRVDEAFRPLPSVPDPAPIPATEATPLPPSAPDFTLPSFVAVAPVAPVKLPEPAAPLSAAIKDPAATNANAAGNPRFETAKPVVFVEAGTLSVSSAVPAEVYMGGKLVGTTPMSLQLIGGRHTLEYRLGDLKTAVAHDIKPNQTTNAVVAFDTTVQINARPWAQVYLDGTTRRPLGQTPLSNVRVPVGGVLVFENPNFATKSHRVTEGDTAIQVAFP